MKKQVISLNQKRFLIVWCCFHSLALACNIIPIRGTLVERGLYEHVNLFSSQFTKGFWPFVRYSYELEGHTYFNGVFTSYDAGAFIFYIALGFGIVFLPKLWNDNAISNKQPQS